MNADLTEHVAQQKVLITRLEEDINRISAWQQNHLQNQQQIQEQVDANGAGSQVDQSLTLQEIFLDQKDEETASAKDSSILTIVKNQRDRLRQQNLQLEEVSLNRQTLQN